MNKEQQFWNWFKENEAKYFFLNQIDDHDEKERLLDELLDCLHIYCDQLFFEVGGLPDEKQDLIITAEGDTDFFDKVESLVKQAPQLEHWNIIAFKPVMGHGYTIKYNELELNPDTMWFIPLHNAKSQKIGLRIYVDDYNPENGTDFLNAAYLILDNILGEKSNALDIGHIEIENLSSVQEKEDLIELIKLPGYIKWKKSQVKI